MANSKDIEDIKEPKKTVRKKADTAAGASASEAPAKPRVRKAAICVPRPMVPQDPVLRQTRAPGREEHI